MWPIVFRLGDAALFSYPLLVSLAYFVGLGLWIKTARPHGISPSKLVNLSLLATGAGWVGARVLFIFVQWMDDPASLSGFWKIWEGGVVYFGGFLAGVFALYFAFPKANIPRKLGFDSAAPALAAAHAVGRLACFLNGCCYGSHCDLPWAVRFSDPYSAAPLHEFLHPTQLYEVFGLILLALILFRHFRKSWDLPYLQRLGSTELYLLSYGVLRFTIEFFRGDLKRGFFGPLSTSQWISICLVFVALLLDLFRHRRHNMRL